MGDGTADRPRYHAFISYSHRDAAFGRRLHRRLESYRLPRRLVGRAGRLGPAPARLSPIFRDREELSAAGDLSAEVRAALAASAALVVVCSPSAAASPWVGREIETFRALHPDRPVLAAVVSGEPADCFHDALRIGGLEPLAADFRKQGDGPRLGLLKLAAGIAGVGLDELVQRDAQRQVASVTAITAGALALTLVMAAMTAVALDARAEAERQRAEAEGLVEFMLGDLRDRLRGVGKVEIMTVVNERALAYYDRDPRELSPKQLIQRAAIFHAMSEDDMTSGEFDRALVRIKQARRATAALLAESPDDPSRIYAQAQNEFWLAKVEYDKGRYLGALPGFRAYRDLVGRLVAIAPENPEYRRELGFAEGNLCAVAGFGYRDMKAALRHCLAGLAAMERVARSMPGDVRTLDNLANRHGWLADAYVANGNYSKALEHRLTQERIIDGLLADSPENADFLMTWVTNQRGLASIEISTGRKAKALVRLEAARRQMAKLVTQDPRNEEWKVLKNDVDIQYRKIITKDNG